MAKVSETNNMFSHRSKLCMYFIFVITISSSQQQQRRPPQRPARPPPRQPNAGPNRQGLPPPPSRGGSPNRSPPFQTSNSGSGRIRPSFKYKTNLAIQCSSLPWVECAGLIISTVKYQLEVQWDDWTWRCTKRSHTLLNIYNWLKISWNFFYIAFKCKKYWYTVQWAHRVVGFSAGSDGKYRNITSWCFCSDERFWEWESLPGNIA